MHANDAADSDRRRSRSGRCKTGGGAVKLDIEAAAPLAPEMGAAILALHDALEAFAQIAPRASEGGRAALFRRVKRGGNGGGDEDLAKNRHARLGFRQSMAGTSLFNLTR